MDSRMKEACISNRPAVVRRCSDDKKTSPMLCEERSREAGSTGLHVNMQGSGVVSVPRASQLVRVCACGQNVLGT